jgi:hypothetical protein
MGQQWHVRQSKDAGREYERGCAAYFHAWIAVADGANSPHAREHAYDIAVNNSTRESESNRCNGVGSIWPHA